MSKWSTPARVFIGFDYAESIAYNVFQYSIQKRASLPVLTAPIMLQHFRRVLTRPWDAKQSNEFAFSRWLVPAICSFEGWAIFADCDMLCRDDIYKLWDMRDDRYAVMVVKHNHKPQESVKYLDRPQTAYEKKNWSSVMLMNCAKCTALTPRYVNEAHGLDLHQFKWLEDDSLIGELPPEWNHLVGYDKENPNAKIAHFTLGGPYFSEFYGCEFTDEWWDECGEVVHCAQRVSTKAKEAAQ